MNERIVSGDKREHKVCNKQDACNCKDKSGRFREFATPSDKSEDVKVDVKEKMIHDKAS